MLHKLLAAAAWTALALIVFLTVSPLDMRPVVTADPNIERFVAFALVGMLFGLAYPRRLVVDASFVMIAAGVLEAFQLITRDRQRGFRRRYGFNGFDHAGTPQSPVNLLQDFVDSSPLIAFHSYSSSTR
jgi:hypothetical protein